MAAGHLVLARPHCSLWDGPMVALHIRLSGHQAGFLRSGYLFAIDPDYARHPIFRRLLLLYGKLLGDGYRMVPLDTRSPMAMRQLRRELQAGRGVVLFPQGTGLHDPLRPDAPGAAWLVERSQCRVTHLHLHHRSALPPKVRHCLMQTVEA